MPQMTYNWIYLGKVQLVILRDPVIQERYHLGMFGKKILKINAGANLKRIRALDISQDLESCNQVEWARWNDSYRKAPNVGSQLF